MSRVHVFADESGNFDFSRKPGASAYYVLTTVVAEQCVHGHALLDLRRELACRGHGLASEFHAAEDTQAVRNEVFALLSQIPLRIDATILEKRKSRPGIRSTNERFYQYAWFYHMKYVAPQLVRPGNDMLVVAASIGAKASMREGFRATVANVLAQVVPATQSHIASWSAASDPWLQIADYCSWAISRKWERGDMRSYGLIQGRIRSEYELFRTGNTFYY